MGFVQRITKTLRTQANRALDRFEDPVETFELARRRQTEMLAEVRQQLADDEAERQQIEARSAPGRSGDLGARHRILVREEEKLRELEARLQDRITEFGSLIETTKASRTAETARGFGSEDAIRKMTEDVEAELRRLEAEIHRRRT